MGSTTLRFVAVVLLLSGLTVTAGGAASSSEPPAASQGADPLDGMARLVGTWNVYPDPEAPPQSRIVFDWQIGRHALTKRASVLAGPNAGVRAIGVIGYDPLEGRIVGVDFQSMIWPENRPVQLEFRSEYWPGDDVIHRLYSVRYPPGEPLMPQADRPGTERRYRETYRFTDADTIAWTTEILDGAEWKPFGGSRGGSTMRRQAQAGQAAAAGDLSRLEQFIGLWGRADESAVRGTPREQHYSERYTWGPNRAVILFTQGPHKTDPSLDVVPGFIYWHPTEARLKTSAYNTRGNLYFEGTLTDVQPDFYELHYTVHYPPMPARGERPASEATTRQFRDTHRLLDDDTMELTTWMRTDDGWQAFPANAEPTIMKRISR